MRNEIEREFVQMTILDRIDRNAEPDEVRIVQRRDIAFYTYDESEIFIVAIL